MSRRWVMLAVGLLAGIAGGAAGMWLLADDGPQATGYVPADLRSDWSTNVVLISMDTTRRDHVGFYGYERNTTPELDRLVAERGVVFDRAITPHTNTAPSHASMLTGLYPTAHGVRRNGMELGSEVPYLPEILQRRGYATGAFVSGYTLDSSTELDRGFHVYDDEDFEDGTREAEDTFAAALPWLRERAKEKAPFFLFFHLFDPHYPYTPPKQDLDAMVSEGAPEPAVEAEGGLERLKEESELTEEQAEQFVTLYDAEIRSADRYIGRLLAELDELGLASDTLVVFVSDHGETLFERPWTFDHGARVFDEQVRVPMAIRFPGDAHAGRRVQGQASHVDLVSTILDVVGMPAPAGVSGRSLVSLVESGHDDWAEPRAVFAHARPEPDRVPRIDAPLSEDGLLGAIRLPNVKLIEYPTEDGGWHSQLCDLVADPAEKNNFVSDKPALAKRLHRELEAWRRATGGDERQAPPELSAEAEEQLRALGYVE